MQGRKRPATLYDIERDEHEAVLWETKIKAHRLEARVPKNDREARVRNFFTSVQDEFWSFPDWPLWVQDMALMEHKPYRERYRLFLFFVFNGLNPLTARMWVVMKDWRGRYIEEDYDRSAWSQLDQQVKDAFSGDIYKKRQGTMWDMINRKPQ